MKWTPEEISQLRELAFAEKSNAEIAATLHKTLSDVYAERSHLGITIPKVAAAKGKEPAPAITRQVSRTERIIKALRTHGNGCFACGYEHNCRRDGCALMHMAADELEKLLAEKQDTDKHLKAISDSLSEQLRRATPENKALAVEQVKVENVQLRAVITENDPDFFKRKCRICGCDWNHPCNDHDYWVKDDLCSACARKPEGSKTS